VLRIDIDVNLDLGRELLAILVDGLAQGPGEGGGVLAFDEDLKAKLIAKFR
jgi:hypothetical protein